MCQVSIFFLWCAHVQYQAFHTFHSFGQTGGLQMYIGELVCVTVVEVQQKAAGRGGATWDLAHWRAMRWEQKATAAVATWSNIAIVERDSFICSESWIMKDVPIVYVC